MCGGRGGGQASTALPYARLALNYFLPLYSAGDLILAPGLKCTKEHDPAGDLAATV
jgi:hypothetical protein